MSGREFNRDVSAAKRAAQAGPVVITDRGVPSHVLISIDDYARLMPQQSIADVLSMDEEIELEIEPRMIDPRVLDL